MEFFTNCRCERLVPAVKWVPGFINNIATTPAPIAAPAAGGINGVVDSVDVDVGCVGNTVFCTVCINWSIEGNNFKFSGYFDRWDTSPKVRS